MKCLARVALVLSATSVAGAALVNQVKVRSPRSSGELMAVEHYSTEGQQEREEVDQRRRTVVPREVQQEVERMAARAEHLAKAGDETAAQEVEGELVDVEAALATRAGDDVKLATEIRSVRADLCAKQGFHSQERAVCESFMRKSCIPDVSLDTKHVEQPLLPEAVCRQFFLAAIDGEEEPEADGPGAPPATAPSTPQPAGRAPAPSVVEAQAPAPGKGKRLWFSKDIESLPEQGYSGDLVDHEDTESLTTDWGQEFGPRARQRSYREICRDHPNNEWCRLHMNYEGSEPMPYGWEKRQPEPAKAGHSASLASLLALAAMLLACRA